MPNARQTPVNKSHSSLGPNLRLGRLASARRTFERLLTYGIRPDDTVVDYGCGTLRLGPCSSSTFKLTAILGSTSTSAFSPRAASSLPTTLLKTKRPTLAVISKEGLARVAARIRAGFAPSGCCNTCRGRARRLFCGPLPSHSCRSHRPAVFVYRARKQANVAQDLGA